MKKIFSLAICVMALLFAGCEPNSPATSDKVETGSTTEITSESVVLTGSATDITTESVVLHGKVNVDISQYEDVEFGMMVSEDKADLNARDGERYKAKVLIGKDFELTLSGLSPETKYYYCAWVFLNRPRACADINNTQYEFGSIKEFETIKENADNTDNPNSTYKAKAFSVSDSKQVIFSPGNLQYHPAKNIWRFAERQSDRIGEANRKCSSYYNGWLDLFGWSTSANNYGVTTSTDFDDYDGSFVDWGTNKIGSDTPNTWRTLTYDEWVYLLNTRPNATSLKGVAQVNGVNGLILLPDSWTCPSGITFKSGFHSSYGVEYYAAYQTFTAEQWSKLEAAGAVFLPASGHRFSSDVSTVQNGGYYWSATKNESYVAYGLYFRSDRARMYNYDRNRGRSVRLVKVL